MNAVSKASSTPGAGCTLMFYETYGKSSPEQELSPHYALLAEDSIVQAVPEHPKKENVFCLSNAYGEVYLFQVSSDCCVISWVRNGGPHLGWLFLICL